MSDPDSAARILNAARPVVEQWLDVAAQFAALRAAAAAQGLDWLRIKAALKAEIENGRRRTRRARGRRTGTTGRGAVMP